MCGFLSCCCVRVLKNFMVVDFLRAALSGRKWQLDLPTLIASKPRASHKQIPPQNLKIDITFLSMFVCRLYVLGVAHSIGQVQLPIRN